MKPSTQPWPDCATRISSASARAIAPCALARASSTRPRWAAITAAGNSPGGGSRPSCVLSSIESAAYRSASSQFPPATRGARGPQRLCLSARGRSGRSRRANLLEERARPVDVGRPPELVQPKTHGRTVVERPLGQRSLERERLFHLRSRYAASGVEVHEAEGGESAAAERGVVDPPGGADGEPLCSMPRSKPSLEAHQAGESQLDVGLERVVALGFRERLAVEGDGVLRVCLDAGQLSQDGRALVARRCRRARPLEQGHRSVAVPGAVLHVGCDEHPPASVVRARWRREPERLLGELDGRRRRAAD